MDNIYFLLRYTPFWAIPTAMIAGEFCYIFWLRKKKKGVFICAVFSLIAIAALCYYYIIGGPERTVMHMMKLVQYYFH